MSGTTEDQAPATPEIPNYSAAPKTEMVNGAAEQWMQVKYGVSQLDPSLPERVLEVRRIDMGDQFDLAEIASDQSNNDVWLSLAIVALSVQKIDGVPLPRGNLTKANLRNTLRQIGPLGVRAVRRTIYEWPGVGGSGSADQVKVAAGN